jgi:adenylate cyclase class 2
MQVEIELKARADDPGALKQRIQPLGVFLGEFLKEDRYWFPQTEGQSGEIPPSGLRLRRERFQNSRGELSRTLRATYKTKEVRQGIEVNQEREFTVSEEDAGATAQGATAPSAFEELLGRLGLRPGIAKEKRGWAWDCQGITLELCEVKGLGWFAELEILAGDDGEATVAAARARLLTLLGRLGIGEDRLETRYYTELLQSAQADEAAQADAAAQADEAAPRVP